MEDNQNENKEPEICSEVREVAKVVDLLETSNKLTLDETQIVSTISEGKRIKDDIQKDVISPIGLYDDLSTEDYDFAIAKARQNLLERDDFNEIKNLKRDLLLVPDQNFCVVSWVGPTFKAKTDVYGFRIMGAFKTLEKAQKYAQRINHLDPVYDVGVMEMNLWCLGYPDESDVIFESEGVMDIPAMEANRDRQLNEIIIKHKTQLEESKQLFEIRKRAIRKSKITKEGNEEDAPIQKVPEGVPTQEMAAIHDKEIEKWIDVKKTKEIQDDDYNIDSKILDFETNNKIPNQEYAVVSFVGYTGTNKRIPICIKGVYATEKEAEERIKKLMYIDDTYDIVPMPLYKWVPCDPDLTTIRQEFKNNRLNDLIAADQKQKEETLSFHQIRPNYAKPEIEGVQNTVDHENDQYNLEGLSNAKISFKDPIEEIISENKNSKEKQSENHLFSENGEVMTATNALINVQKFDSEDIRMSGRKYHQYLNDNDVDEEPPIEEYSFNPVLTDKDIKEPMFKEADQKLKELEEKIQNLMVTEGISEKEARDRFRLKFDSREETKYELDPEDLKPIPKPVQKTIDFEGMAEKIDRLKKEGRTPAEIRKIMSGGEE